jgi:hypothetical protein
MLSQVGQVLLGHLPLQYTVAAAEPVHLDLRLLLDLALVQVVVALVVKDQLQELQVLMA